MSTLLLTYLGWRKFPRDLSSFEVQQFFSLSQADRYALRRHFRSRSRLGAAIQLGFVRMTGTTLQAFDYIPREVLAYVGKQLRLGSPELATIRALYRRRPTLFEHQSWACKYAGVDIIDSRPILQQFMSNTAPCPDALPWIHQVTNAICKVALRIWTSTAEKVRFWT
jgi:hypothetical protein